MSFNEVKKSYIISDVMVTDRIGISIEKIRVHKSERSLEWTTLDEVSHAFKTLLLKSEDRNFYEHSGVDWTALVVAGIQHFAHSGNRGASTISMQLVGLLDKNVDKHRRTFKAKWTQIEKARHLEKSWKKHEIFEAYINLVAFRGELVGITSASFGYFNKSPASLNNEESALLVSLLRSPNAGADLVAKRACQLLGTSDCSSLKNLSQLKFNEKYEIKRPRIWLSILDKSFIKKSPATNVMKTTLDKTIQETALLSLQDQVRLYKEQNLGDGAVLVLNNKTGEVVAYIGNAGENYSPSAYVDGVRAYRQAGSTLKPFIYGTAIELNLIQANSILDDSPVDIPIGNHSIYYPRNYDNTFKGPVSAATALGSSLNVPAVKVLQLAGPELVVKNLSKFGFSKMLEASHYGPSLALGSVDVTLWDLTQAYRKLAQSKIFSKSTRESVFDMLSSDEFRQMTFGSSSVLKLPFPAAVKTGTSKDMRDNWCIGYTEQYTVGVWVGNLNGKAMWNVSGDTGAAPIWRAVMLKLHQDNTPRPKIMALKRTQEFSSDTPEFTKTITNIRYPIESEIVGLDPEIPAHLQKMHFEILAPTPGSKLYLDNEFYSPSENIPLWAIMRGSHHLVLKNSEDNILDEVRFEVR